MSWEKAWREGRTGWDAGASPPVLHELLAERTLPEGRALVPGCGAGWDVFTLAEAGRDVTGLDLAPTAATRFERLRVERGVDPSRARIEVGDFFAHAPDAPYDVIWDYTFLCALPPAMRPDWEQKMRTLVAPSGTLATLIFPAQPEPLIGPDQPPFPLMPEHVEGLLAEHWEKLELRPVERSHEGRVGLEWIARWRLR